MLSGNSTFESLLERIQANQIQTIDFQQWDVTLAREQLEQLESALHANTSVLEIILPEYHLGQVQEEEKGKEKEGEKKAETSNPDSDDARLWDLILEQVAQNKTRQRDQFNRLIFCIQHKAINELNKDQLKELSLEQLRELAVVMSQTSVIKKILPDSENVEEEKREAHAKDEREVIWELIEALVKREECTREIAKIDKKNAEDKKNFKRDNFIDNLKYTGNLLIEINLAVFYFFSEVMAAILSYLTLIKPLYLLSNLIFGAKETVKVTDFTFWDKESLKSKIIEREYAVNSFTRYVVPFCHSISILGKVLGALPALFLVSVWMLSVGSFIFFCATLGNLCGVSNDIFTPQSTWQLGRDRKNAEHKINTMQKQLTSWKADYYLKLACFALGDNKDSLANEYFDKAATELGEETIERDKLIRNYLEPRQSDLFKQANAAYARQAYPLALEYFIQTSKIAKWTGDNDLGTYCQRMIAAVEMTLAGEKVIPGFKVEEKVKEEVEEKVIPSFNAYSQVLAQQGVDTNAGRIYREYLVEKASKNPSELFKSEGGELATTSAISRLS